jgi:hypothetical protein
LGNPHALLPFGGNFPYDQSLPGALKRSLIRWLIRGILLFANLRLDISGIAPQPFDESLHPNGEFPDTARNRELNEAAARKTHLPGPWATITGNENARPSV